MIKDFISTQQIAQRIAEMGQQIAKDYAGKKLLVLGVLKGSFIFMADLIRAIPNELECEFVRVSSYRGGMHSGNMELVSGIQPQHIQGKDILIVEDIVDTGNTMVFLTKYLQQYQPASMKICSLLLKKQMLQHEIEVHYVGFSIPNVFVVGYGLDVRELYRNYPAIGEWQHT